MFGYIYIIKNRINDKAYIGQTKKTLCKRLNEHFRQAKYTDKPTHFQNAILKYDKDNFYIEELERVEANDYISLCKKLDEREYYYIKEYNTINYGYNSKKVGITRK